MYNKRIIDWILGLNVFARYSNQTVSFGLNNLSFVLGCMNRCILFSLSFIGVDTVAAVMMNMLKKRNLKISDPHIDHSIISE